MGLSLYSAITFGLLRFVFEVLGGSSAQSAAISAAVTGVVFGLIFGPLSRRMGDRLLEAMGDVPTSKQREVRRATTRGPVPDDPEVRRGAIWVIDHRIDTLRRMRWAIAMWVLFMGLSAWLALSETRWWWLGVPFFGFFLVQYLWTERRLQRRRALILAAEDRDVAGR